MITLETFGGDFKIRTGTAVVEDNADSIVHSYFARYVELSELIRAQQEKSQGLVKVGAPCAPNNQLVGLVFHPETLPAYQETTGELHSFDEATIYFFPQNAGTISLYCESLDRQTAIATFPEPLLGSYVATLPVSYLDLLST